MDDKLNKFIMNAWITKTKDNTYKAVLSDDSIDREDEIVGKKFLKSALDSKVIGLIDHENKVMGQVCSWENKEVRMVKGHNTLIAEPNWFMSNPNAKVLRGMLDDGANIGISIGAIPKSHDVVKIEGKEYKRYTDGEIIEASFVAIPANKSAQIEAIAKQLKLNDRVEAKMDEKLDKAKEIIEAMNDSTKEQIEKVLKVNDIDEDIYKDLLKNMDSNETLKAKEMIETLKDSTEEVVIKVLVAAGIKEDVYKDLLTKPNSGGGSQPGGASGSKKNPDDDDSSEHNGKPKPKVGGKSLTEEEIQKMVEEGVKKRIDESPIFKSQLNIMSMTPEQQKDKADELLEKGMLPILN